MRDLVPFRKAYLTLSILSLVVFLGPQSTLYRHFTGSFRGFVLIKHALNQRQQPIDNLDDDDRRNEDDEGSNDVTKPPPMKVLEQYKRWHSEETLNREYASKSSVIHNRTFALAYYTCPFAAGNQMNEFINALLSSIITNRTLLWKYYDRGACEQYLADDFRGKNLLRCGEDQNTEQDCNAILERADWIPSFDKWNARLGLLLQQKLAWEMSTDLTATNAATTSKAVTIPRRVEGDILMRANQQPVVKFSREFFQVDWHNKLLQKYPNNTPKIKLPVRQSSLSRARVLYEWGTPFVYGMIFHSVFNFSQAVLDSSVPEYSHPDAESGADDSRRTTSLRKQQPQQQHQQEEDKENWVDFRGHGNYNYSVAIHSRHPLSRDDGCDVTRELTCLNSILPSLEEEEYPYSCLVFIMADRQCTLSTLSQHLLTGSQGGRKCTVALTSQQKEHRRPSKLEKKKRRPAFSEHGPFAGVGYFRDVIVALRATQSQYDQQKHTTNTAVAVTLEDHPDNTIRSSSSFLLALLDYQQKMTAWNNQLELQPRSEKQRSQASSPSLSEASDNLPSIDVCKMQQY